MMKGILNKYDTKNYKLECDLEDIAKKHKAKILWNTVVYDGGYYSCTMDKKEFLENFPAFQVQNPMKEVFDWDNFDKLEKSYDWFIVISPEETGLEILAHELGHIISYPEVKEIWEETNKNQSLIAPEYYLSQGSVKLELIANKIAMKILKEHLPGIDLGLFKSLVKRLYENIRISLKLLKILEDNGYSSTLEPRARLLCIDKIKELSINKEN